jgi:hypothetical protein
MTMARMDILKKSLEYCEQDFASIDEELTVLLRVDLPETEEDMQNLTRRFRDLTARHRAAAERLFAERQAIMERKTGQRPA